MNRRSFLRSGGAAVAAAGMGGLRWIAAEPDPPPDDEALLARARQRIDHHRRGAGVIVVTDADGRPVPGAAVKMEQVSHAFRFGGNFYRFDRIGDPDREESYRRKFAGLLGSGSGSGSVP